MASPQERARVRAALVRWDQVRNATNYNEEQAAACRQAINSPGRGTRKKGAPGEG
jgi:hypothetical protein